MISKVEDALPGQKYHVNVTMQTLTEDGLGLIVVVPMRRIDAMVLRDRLSEYLLGKE